MNEVKIENRFKVAVKRALSGDTTGQDLIAIVKFQMRELGERDTFEYGMLVMYSAAFN
jgi:hypothetical protein